MGSRSFPSIPELIAIYCRQPLSDDVCLGQPVPLYNHSDGMSTPEMSRHQRPGAGTFAARSRISAVTFLLPFLCIAFFSQLWRRHPHPRDLCSRPAVALGPRTQRIAPASAHTTTPRRPGAGPTPAAAGRPGSRQPRWSRARASTRRTRPPPRT